MAVPHKSLLAISVLSAWSINRFGASRLIAGSMWKTAVLIEIVLSFAALIWSVIIHPRFISPLRHLPQPSDGSFIQGQFWNIIAEPTGQPHRRWMATIPNDGLIHYTSWPNGPRVFISAPETLREVLTQKSYEFVKPGAIIRGIGRILGIGVLLAEGDEHHRQRRNLMPAFQYRHIKDLYPVFWDKTRELILALDRAISQPAEADEKPRRVVEVGKWTSRSTLDIIGVAGMGKSFNAIDDDQNELYQIYQRIFSPNRTAAVMAFLGLFVPYAVLSRLPIKRNNDINDASNSIKQICRGLIHEKKEKLAKGQDSDVDILSVAIKSGGFSDEDLVNQMMTFLVAGHETTSSALTWALCYLCQYPTIQRLRDELAASDLPNPRSPSSKVTADILDPPRFPYLHAVCSEVLRYQPPVPFTVRMNPKDAVIRGQVIPAGTTVVMSPLAVNLSKNLWGEDADQFNPDRWLDIPDGDQSKAKLNNSGGATSNYAMMTFLHGQRSCIGQGFSRAEFACLLAGWVSAFEVELEDKDKRIEVQSGITQRVKGGLSVVLTPVDGGRRMQVHCTKKADLEREGGPEPSSEKQR